MDLRRTPETLGATADDADGADAAHSLFRGRLDLRNLGADDRPSDPFGNHTIELDKEATLFEVWESLRDKVLLDKADFHSCIEVGSAPVRKYRRS
jgi:hypothetical protein